MVSFHTTQLPTQRNSFPSMEDFSKKRKWDELKVEEISQKPQKAKNMTSLFGTQLHLDTPLPLEWQRCLDIKSGQIYFYNTRTQKRTSRDPRLSTPEPPAPVHMSLDLELNLPCGSPEKNQVNDNCVNYFIGNHKNSDNKNSEYQGLTRSPSWLTFDMDQQEMVTAVCKKCHMLVMMSKSSPTCPNCKFPNPLDEAPPTLFKKRLSSS